MSRVSLGVQALRQLADLTQARLARKLGVHRVTLARWEGGEHHPDAADVAGLEDVFAEILLDRDVGAFRRHVLAIPLGVTTPSQYRRRRMIVGGGDRGPGDFAATIDDGDFKGAARIRVFLLVKLALSASKVELSRAAFERTLGLPAGSLCGVPSHPKPGRETDAPVSVVSGADVGVELQVRLAGTTRDELLAVYARHLNWDAAKVAEQVGIPRIQAEAIHQLRTAIAVFDSTSVALAAGAKERESRGSSPLLGVDRNGGERNGTAEL